MESFSYQMHDQTERPGQLFPQDVHNIVHHRYDYAAKLAENKRILEVGAGHLIGSRLLALKASQYMAGDYSDENINLIRNRKDVSFPVIQFDAHALPFKPHSFDVVVSLAMIYYLDLNKFISQVKRILQSGGKLFFCTSNKDVPGFVPAPYTTRYYSIPELNQLFTQHGFDCEFRGAFLASGGHFLKRQAKAKFKNYMKAFVNTFIPNGKSVWNQLRKSYAGPGIPLPWHVDEINAESVDCARLPCDKKNADYRIIYGIASLME